MEEWESLLLDYFKRKLSSKQETSGLLKMRLKKIEDKIEVLEKYIIHEQKIKKPVVSPQYDEGVKAMLEHEEIRRKRNREAANRYAKKKRRDKIKKELPEVREKLMEIFNRTKNKRYKTSVLAALIGRDARDPVYMKAIKDLYDEKIVLIEMENGSKYISLEEWKDG